MEASQVGDARRQAATLAHRLLFDETGRGKVSLVVAEAATNLVQHGGGGYILLNALEQAGATGLEILAVDSGAGMANVARCLRDGYSTAGTPGTGLGAMQRQSSEFDIYSLVGAGTVVMARLWAGNPPDTKAALTVGAVCAPVDGETECGDTWSLAVKEGRFSLLIADGLGHGPQAAQASREAARIFALTAEADSPQRLLENTHAALRSTRGAAIAIADGDFGAHKVTYAGVGNIAGAIYVAPGHAQNHSMVSHNGTVGHQMRKVQEFVYACPSGALLLMHSDGLRAQWHLERYPGLSACDPALIAAVLYRDFKRDRDDACVVVTRIGRNSNAV